MKNRKAARRCAAAILVSIMVALLVESSLLTAKIYGIIGWSWAATILRPGLIPLATFIVAVIVYAFAVHPEGGNRSK